jgi:Tol biopolymer transport system component
MIVLAGCDQLFGLQRVNATDAAIDVLPPTIVPFSPPAPLAGALNTAGEDDDPSLTEDLLELYLLRNADLHVSKRATVTDPWPAAVVISELATAAVELRPSVSADGLTLYFARTVGAQRDIFVSTRAARTAQWAAPIVLALDLNTVDSDELPGWSSPDGLTLLVESSPVVAGHHDVYVATRASVDMPFTSVPLTDLNLASDEGGPWATAAATTILFESDRAGSMDIWEAIAFGSGWHVDKHPELDSQTAFKNDGTPWLSADGKVIVFSSNRTGNDDLYMATR